MARLPAPSDAASRATVARGGWAKWLGIGACALLLLAWMLVAQADRSGPRALEPTAPDAQAAPTAAPDLHGDESTVPIARRPATGGEELEPAAPMLDASATPVVALLVAGSVVTPGASGAEDVPLAQVRLYVDTQRRVRDGWRGSWTTTRLRAVSDAHGRFVIERPAVNTDAARALEVSPRDGRTTVALRVTARSMGYIDTSLEFEPGRADLRLTLPHAGSLSARVVHGAVEDGPKFSLTLEAGGERFRRWTSAHEPEAFRGVPPGEATLTVHIEGDPEPLVVLRSLVVPPGAACSDPRLDPLDVSARFAVYGVRVLNDRGEAVPQAKFTAVTKAQDGASEARPVVSLRAQVDSEAVGVLGEGWWRVHARAQLAPEIVVSAIDHVSVSPAVLSHGATVTLRSLPRFLIELADGLPAGDVAVEIEKVGQGSYWVPAQPVIRWIGPTPCRARARLVRNPKAALGRGGAGARTLGTWVDFDVPGVWGRARRARLAVVSTATWASCGELDGGPARQAHAGKALDSGLNVGSEAQSLPRDTPRAACHVSAIHATTYAFRVATPLRASAARSVPLARRALGFTRPPRGWGRSVENSSQSPTGPT